jgi:hypothetical protein
VSSARVPGTDLTGTDRSDVTTRGRPDPASTSPSASMANRSAWHEAAKSVVWEMLSKARWMTPSEAPAPRRRLAASARALTMIPLGGVEPSHVVLGTRAGDNNLLLAAFRKAAEAHLTGPAPASS